MSREKVKCPKCNSKNPIYDEATNNYVCRNKDCKLEFSPDAIGYYQKPLGIDRKDKNDWIREGDTFFDLQKYEKAIECYDTALKIDSEDKIFMTFSVYSFISHFLFSLILGESSLNNCLIFKESKKLIFGAIVPSMYCSWPDL